MRLFILLITALILTSACNLNSQPATPTAAPPTPAFEQTMTIQTTTIPASLTPLPGAISTGGVTRTPFGIQSAPTAQTIGTPGAFPTGVGGERASISSPANGATVSGLPLTINGVVSNLTQDSFTLQVFDPTGQSLTPAQTIGLSNPNHVADVLWSASVMVSGL